MDNQQDIEDVLWRLKKSKFRARFKLCPKDILYVQQRGLEEILAHAEQFLTQRIAPAEPPNDGKQTPYKGHPVFLAQHATATCCRKCIEKWHGLAAGVPLTPEQIRYLVSVIGLWLQEQLSNRISTLSRSLFE